MDAKYACSVCRSLLSCVYEIDDFLLLMGFEFWRSANTPVRSRGLLFYLGAPVQHSPLEPRERAHHPGVVVSIASVRQRQPAARAAMRSINVCRSRNERDPRLSVQVATPLPLR